MLTLRLKSNDDDSLPLVRLADAGGEELIPLGKCGHYDGLLPNNQEAFGTIITVDAFEGVLLPVRRSPIRPVELRKRRCFKLRPLRCKKIYRQMAACISVVERAAYV
jgi:hypothetical protein